MTDDELKVKLFDNLLSAYHVSGDTIKAWGDEAQLNKTVEECAELIVAIQHAKTRTLDVRAVASEIADVLVMTICAARVIGIEIVSEEMNKKITRLRGRLDTVKPQLDLSDKYVKAIERSTELEKMYFLETAKVDELTTQLKRIQSMLPQTDEDDEKIVDDLLAESRKRSGSTKRTIKKKVK
jgi:NTP pyrophosphatase (non-canonical NTP hydrolase)